MGFLEGLLHVTILVLGSLIGAGIGTLIWAGYTRILRGFITRYNSSVRLADWRGYWYANLGGLH